MQPETEELHYLGEVLVNEAGHSATATQALLALCGHGGSCCAVSQILKSVVREIHTLRSEGVGTAFSVVPSTRRFGWVTTRTYPQNELRY
ncbi:MAG TPA: hypothetical protein ENI27_00865 [bacterium]|nr:hypothetical protein [bacterium]